MNKWIAEKEIQVAIKHRKRCSTSHLIRERHKVKYAEIPLAPRRLAKIQSPIQILWWQGCGETGTLERCWWEYNPCGEQPGNVYPVQMPISSASVFTLKTDLSCTHIGQETRLLIAV